jgi:outer membrane protein OmpA-like peptidoglycan-associated protein
MKYIRTILCVCALFGGLQLHAQKDSALAEVIKMRETLSKYQTQTVSAEGDQLITLKKSTYDSLITLLNSQTQKIDMEHMEIEAIRQRLLNSSDASLSHPPHSNVIYFETGSASISKDGESDIRRMMDAMGSTGTFIIEGYADITGIQEANTRLSQERADAVKNYLVSAFKLKTENLVIKAYGSSRKVCETNDSDCLRQNRRVEISKK